MEQLQTSIQTMKKPTLFRLLVCFVLAVLGVVAFSTPMEISGFSEHSNITMADNTLLWSVFAVLLTCFYLRAGVTEKRREALPLAVMAVVFGFLNVIGHSMHVLDSWDFLFGNLYQMMLGSMCALGYAGLFYAVGITVFSLLDRGAFSAVRDADKPCGRVLSFYETHPRLCALCVIGMVYLFWLLLFYPGCTNNDINYQLRQFFGAEPWTNSHPVLSTVIMGGSMWLGKLLGSDNLGMFFYMLLQAGVFLIVFTEIVMTVRRLGAARWLQISVLLFYAVLPVFGGYAVQGMKDGLFAGVFAWFVLLVMELLLSLKRDEAFQAMTLVRYGLAAVLTALLRSSAVYLVLPAMLLLAVLAWKKKTLRIQLAAAALGTAVVVFGLIDVLLPALGVIPCNKTESRSIPFQQTARTVRDHGETITAEERAAIDGVLKFDEIGKVYMPVLSDPVKDTYHQRGLPTEEVNLAAYEKVWRDMFHKYPDSYVQATLGNSYGYFSFTPSIQTQNGHTGMCFMLYRGETDGKVVSETYRLQFPQALEPIRKLVHTAAYLVDAVPVVNLLYACAFYFWGVLLLALYVTTRKQPRMLVVMLPVITLMIGCIGSSVNDCFRYEVPVAAAFPIVILCAVLAAARIAAKQD